MIFRELENIKPITFPDISVADKTNADNESFVILLDALDDLLESVFASLDPAAHRASAIEKKTQLENFRATAGLASSS